MKPKPQVVVLDVPVTMVPVTVHGDPCKLDPRLGQIRAKFTYSQEDPVAVDVVFYSKKNPKDNVAWCFARELLVLGACSYEGAGIGDVHIWSTGFLYKWLSLRLSTNEKTLLVSTPMWRMRRFIRAMNQVLPFATVRTMDIDLDNELATVFQTNT
jgi:hypothetical protein